MFRSKAVLQAVQPCLVRRWILVLSAFNRLKALKDKLRILAVADTTRDAFQPHVPTFAEAGFNVPLITSPIMLFAPIGVDAEIVSGIEAALKDIVAAPEFAELVGAKGTLPLYRTGADAEKDAPRR